MITIERAWPMGDNPNRIFYMAKVDDLPAQMFWQRRDSKFGRLLEQIESVPVS